MSARGRRAQTRQSTGVGQHDIAWPDCSIMAMWAKQAANLVGEELFANLHLQQLHPPRLPCTRTKSASRCRRGGLPLHPPRSLPACRSPRTAQRSLDMPGRRQMAKQGLSRRFLLVGRTFGSSDGSDRWMRLWLTPSEGCVAGAQSSDREIETEQQ
jgi:hypothetical protein